MRVLRARRALAPRSVAVAVVLGLAVGAAACSSGPAAPTQGEYAAQADSLCQATEDTLTTMEEERVEDLQADAAEGGSGIDPRPDRWMRARVVPEYRELDGNLRSLRPPEGDEAYISDLYDDLTRQIDLLMASPSGGRDTIREHAELRKRFAAYGMKECGRV